MIAFCFDHTLIIIIDHKRILIYDLFENQVNLSWLKSSSVYKHQTLWYLHRRLVTINNFHWIQNWKNKQKNIPFIVVLQMKWNCINRCNYCFTDDKIFIKLKFVITICNKQNDCIQHLFSYFTHFFLYVLSFCLLLLECKQTIEPNTIMYAHNEHNIAIYTVCIWSNMHITKIKQLIFPVFLLFFFLSFSFSFSSCFLFFPFYL